MRALNKAPPLLPPSPSTRNCGGGHNFGRDRGRAAVVADGNPCRHRVHGPCQTGVLRPPPGTTNRLVPVGAIAACKDTPLIVPVKLNGPKALPVVVPVKEPGGMVTAQGADLEGHRLGEGIDPVAGAPQGEARLNFERIVCSASCRNWIVGVALKAANGTSGIMPTPSGVDPHRDRVHHRHGGRSDHRDIAGALAFAT